MVYTTRKHFWKRHIYELSLWTFVSVIVIYILSTQFPHLSTTQLLEARVSLEISEGNATEIVSSQGDGSKDKALLFIAVLTHWRRWKRRDSIRETWMTQCGEDVRCLFFTDDVGAKENEKQWLHAEVSLKQDTILMPMTGTSHFTFLY